MKKIELEKLVIVLQEQNKLLQEQIKLLQQENKMLREQVKELERRLRINSNNSSKPPSSDGLSKPKASEARINSLREKSGKKPGGQPGHDGTTRNQVEKPDFVKHHFVEFCPDCNTDLKDVKPLNLINRQVIDIPEQIEPVVTDHIIEKKKCPNCKKKVLPQKADEICSPVQYGPRIQTFATALHVKQLIPMKRVVSIIGDFFNIALSIGTIANQIKKTAKLVKPFVESIKQELLTNEGVKHLDESGFRIEGKTQWVHVMCNEQLAYYRPSKKRGDVPKNIQGTIVHDHFSSYRTQINNEVIHAFCNAHHLRELTATHEFDGEKWSYQMIRLLKLANRKQRSNFSEITDEWLVKFYLLFDKVIGSGLKYHEALDPLSKKSTRGPIKRRIGHNLLLRLQKYKDGALLFLRNPEVPFTNNRAESDIRMIKIKHKISGSFRSNEGAKNFLDIKSYIQSLQKQGKNITHTLTLLFEGQQTPLVGVPE